MSLNQVVLSSWSAVFSSFTEAQLTQAAFNDHDISAYGQHDLTHESKFLSEHEQILMGPQALQACLAVEKVFKRAKLWTERNLLRGKGKRFRHSRAAIIAGSSVGMIGPTINTQQQNLEKFHPYTLSKLRGNSIAAPLAIRFGLGAGDFSLSAASATGGQAVWLAAKLIQLNIADVVVVVCADVSKNSGFTQKALNAMGSVASSFSSRPLCSQRDGMRPVDASAAMILESELHATQRGFKPMARWIGGAIKNDCHHLIAPQPDALGLEEAVKEAFSTIPTEQSIDWLALHATGTKAWDFIEAHLVTKLFGQHLPHISAFKRTFGHALGSACLLSMAMVAEGLANQILPKLPQDIDPSLNLNLANINKTQAKTAMNWSVGMGGTVAVNLFEACHDI